MEGQAAPTRTDVEDALAALDQQLGSEVALLGKLRVLQRSFRTIEIGAAILHVGIEEQRVEPAVQIVVMRHVVARSPARIELPEATDQVAKPLARPCPAWPRVRLVHRDG